MDRKGLRVTKNAYFSLLTHSKKFLLSTFCDLTAETGVSFQIHRQKHKKMETCMDGQTDVEVEMIT